MSHAPVAQSHESAAPSPSGAGVGETANSQGLHPHWQYIVLHRSVADKPGLAAVHAAHAAGESCFDGPAPADTHSAVLVAETSQDLYDLAERLRAAGIRHMLMNEPDAPYFGAATALGTTPTRDRATVRPFFAAFKVLR